jgi:hypothetical protein
VIGELLALSFVTGLLVKFADDIADMKLAFNYGVYVGIAYGLCIAYVVSQSELSALWLGVVVAMILMGKVNDIIHSAGVVTVAIPVLFIPLKEFNFMYFLVFIGAAALDEMKFERGALELIAKQRLALEIAALAVSVYSMNPIFFGSIFLFDVGYRISGRVFPRLIPSRQS